MGTCAPYHRPPAPGQCRDMGCGTITAARIAAKPPGCYTLGACCIFGGGGDQIRTDYIPDQDLEVILALLTPANRLACQVSMHTGIRISDVLSLKPAQLIPRPTIVEAKTGKRKRISLTKQLLGRLKAQAGPEWVFPGRISGHRTRQAVWADIKRAQRAMRLPANIGPHTLRKVYAVRLMHQAGDLAKVQKALNHDDQAVTMLYAMADYLTQQRQRDGTRKRCR